MTKSVDFDLETFLPYLLNLAAEASSLDFQNYYKAKYGMLRTEWRVVFHLGRYGQMTAKEISARARTHKTKVSRAVAALEDKRFLKRTTSSFDRRHEDLELTAAGKRAFGELTEAAQLFDESLSQELTAQENAFLRSCLKKIAGL